MSAPSLSVLQTLMTSALAQAEIAYQQQEVPVGAIVAIPDGAQWQVIASAHNQVRSLKDPSAHAEVLAIRAASRALQNERLNQAWLVVTLEPCVMCVGTLLQARIAGLAFGAREPKTGACGSAFDLLSDPAHLHKPVLVEKIMEDASKALLQRFFAERRGA